MIGRRTLLFVGKYLNLAFEAEVFWVLFGTLSSKLVVIKGLK